MLGQPCCAAVLSLPCITTPPQGVAELKRDMSERAVLTEMPEIHQFLDGFYLSRIGIRILIGARHSTARSSRACLSHHHEATGLPSTCVLGAMPVENIRFAVSLPSILISISIHRSGCKWPTASPLPAHISPQALD